MSKISELSDGGSLVSSDYLIAVRSGGNVKVRMDQINVDQIDLGDNEFIRLGNSQDLTIVHDASNSIINQAGIGDLLIQKAGSTKLTVNSSGIDVTGTVTADGLTVANTGNITLDSGTGEAHSITLSHKGSYAEMNAIELAQGSTTYGNNQIKFLNMNSTGSVVETMRISGGGDISFYEDTGTTPKLTWSASNESLTVPTLVISDGAITTTAAAGDHTVFNSTGADADFRVRTGANTHSLYVQGNTGNVGIGTSSQVSELDVAGTTPTLTIKDTQNKSWTSADTTLGELAFRTSDTSGIGAHNVAFVRAVNEVASGSTPSGALSFGVAASNANASEAMRLDASSNLLVGTTSSSGDTANSKPVVAGNFTTKYGVTSIASTNTWTTVHTFGSNQGNFMVSMRASGTGNIADNSVSIVAVNNTATTSTILLAGSRVQIRIVGLTLQVLQTVFAGANINWSIMSIGN